MWYLFRIESNLLDATVCITKSKKRAIEMIKRDCILKKDRGIVDKVSCSLYEELTGLKKKFPAPYEIVEFGILRRYRIPR